MTTTISSSAVEGALLVRMRRTERELREIEGEVQRWKETLSRGTRYDSRTSNELGNGGLDELPGLCAEALQAAMTLRRRAEAVRRSMTYIRNTAAEQSAARTGVSGNHQHQHHAGSSSTTNTPAFGNSPGQTRSPSTTSGGPGTVGNSNNKGPSASTTYHSGGGSALAYFVEDFVNSEFGMQEQAWWDVMTDIEGVEALAVSLLSVPSSEVSEQKIRDAASLHQSRPAEWTQENWDASVSASVGLPAGMLSEMSVGTSSPTARNGNRFSSHQQQRSSPLSPSSLYTSFTSAPISDLLLRRLQEQNRQKGLYTSSSTSGGGGLADDNYNNQTSAHVGPIFASLAANPEVMSASDFDRLPKSDPLALFLSQMGGQLEEEQRRLRQQLMGGGGGAIQNLAQDSVRSAPNGGILAGAFDSQAPSYLQVRPDGNVYSPERMGQDYLERQREEEEKARLAQEQSTEAMMERKKKEAEEREKEELERIEKEVKRKQAIDDVERKKKEEEEARMKAEEEEIARKKKEERDRREAELAKEEAEMKKKEEEIAQQIKDQEEAAAKAEKLRQLELAEEEAAAEMSNSPTKTDDDEKKKENEAAAKIQAVKRGHDARKEFEKLKGETPERKQQKEKTDNNNNNNNNEVSTEANKKDSIPTQEALHAKNAIPEDEQEKKELEEAAKKIQTAQRGNAARKELQRRRAESVAVNNNKNEKEQQSSSTPTNVEKEDSSASPEKASASAASASPAEKSTSEGNADDADGDSNNINAKVDAALASGEWKKVTDKSGREYFYHPATKKTCWDLHKEMKKGCKHSKKDKK